MQWNQVKLLELEPPQARARKDDSAEEWKRAVNACHEDSSGL